MLEYLTLLFTSAFMDSLEPLSRTDRRRVRHARDLLEANERHPSVRVHQLSGRQAGIWTAYASRSLRITFEHRDDGRKHLLAASHHYGD